MPRDKSTLLKTTMNTKIKASLGLTSLLLLVLIYLDMMGTGGAIYRFVLTQMGVSESLALYSSLAITTTFLLVGFGFRVHEWVRPKTEK